MPNYFIGVIVGFLEPILHAWCNVLDNYFSNKLFPSLATLLFFGTLLNVVFLPIIIFLDPPQMLSATLLGIVFIIGVIDVFYLFPYYWALRHTDTSIVASLFSLGRVFIPIIAFFVIGEQLHPLQYVGFFIIVAAATFLTLDLKQLRFNKAFFLMLLVSLVMSVQAILYKYVFEAGASWGSVITALTIFEVFIAGAIMFWKHRWSAIKEDFQKIRANLKLFVLQQILEWGGNVSGAYAVSVLPVTVARAIVSTQSFFVLVYAAAFGRRYPNLFNEVVSPKEFVKKLILFAFIVFGVVLVVANGFVLDI